MGEPKQMKPFGEIIMEMQRSGSSGLDHERVEVVGEEEFVLPEVVNQLAVEYLAAMTLRSISTLWSMCRCNVKMTIDDMVQYWEREPIRDYQEGFINLNEPVFPDLAECSPEHRARLRDVIARHPEYLLEVSSWLNAAPVREVHQRWIQ